jgi:hypothetical protein
VTRYIIQILRSGALQIFKVYKLELTLKEAKEGVKQCRQADRQQQTKMLEFIYTVQFNNADILVGFCGFVILWLLSCAAFLSS